MSIDNYYSAIDGHWVRINTSDDWEACCTALWVDICHGGRFAMDEHYYFAELASHSISILEDGRSANS
jgi:hypothetical protein